MENKKELSLESLKTVSGGASENGKKAYIGDRCVECGSCADICPVEAIYPGNLAFSVNENLCTGCGRCVDSCPLANIEMR